MRHGLTRLVLGEVGFVQIDEGKYREIDAAKRLLLETLYIEQKFDLIVSNLLDFETDLLSLAARNMLTEMTESRSIFLDKNEITRRVVNLLSACRLYTDHVKHHVGEISSLIAITEDVNKYFSEEYDKSFAYRFMEALRNHVQHRGFPFHSLTYAAGWTSHEPQGRLIFSVVPTIDGTILKEDGKFKSSVLKELQEHGGEIDLRDMTRKYIEGIWSAHSRIRKLLASEVKRSEALIGSAVESFLKETNGDSPIGLAAVIENEDEIVLEKIPLHGDLITLRQFYERRNRGLANLSKRTVSSEVIKNRKHL